MFCSVVVAADCSGDRQAGGEKGDVFDNVLALQCRSVLGPLNSRWGSNATGEYSHEPEQQEIDMVNQSMFANS